MAREFFNVTQDSSVNVLELTMPAGTDVSEFDRLNQSALAELELKAADGWVMDMSQCSYVGSAALGFMINVRQRIKQAGGTLVLCGVSSYILATMRASSLGKFFTIVEGRRDAIETIDDWRKSRKRKKKS